MKETVIPIQKKLIRFVLLSLVIVSIISTVILFVFIARQAFVNVKASSQNQVKLLQLNIGKEMKSVEQMQVGLMFNSTIQDLLMDESLLSSIDSQNVIQSVLINARNFSDVGNIILFDINGRMLTSSDGYDNVMLLKNQKYYEQLMSTHGEPLWISRHRDKGDYRFASTEVITLAQKVRRLDPVNPLNTGKVLGYIICNIGVEFFNSMLKQANWNNKGSLTLFSDDYSVVSSTKEISPLLSIMGESQITKGLLVVQSEMDRYGWLVQGVLPFMEVFSDIRQVVVVDLISICLFLLIFILFAIHMGQSISTPLVMLEQEMAKAQVMQENLPVISGSHIKEIDSIEHSYQEMVCRLSRLTEQVLQSQLQRKELEVVSVRAKLNALQHQINPHFLYNTLDSINWMADMHGNEDIVKMVTRLADFLRFNVNDEEMVTLDKELENVDNYLYIQKIRYGERFEYTRTGETDISSIHILKLMIQPLIENSILHGVENQSETVHIFCNIKVDKDLVSVSIRDDGKGLKSMELKALWENIETGKSIGMGNVYGRLKLFYGEKATFLIDSTFGEGTCVSFSFPLNYEKI